MFQQVEGACFDLDYARETVSHVVTVSQFFKVSRLLESAIELKKQLDDEQQQQASSTRLTDRDNLAVDNSSQTAPSLRIATGDSLTITPKSFD